MSGVEAEHLDQHCEPTHGPGGTGTRRPPATQLQGVPEGRGGHVRLQGLSFGMRDVDALQAGSSDGSHASMVVIRVDLSRMALLYDCVVWWG
jgi:hypothetical protein